MSQSTATNINSAEQSVRKNRKQIKARSHVWNFMDQDSYDGSSYQCLKCPKRVLCSARSTTTNLIHHLASMHEITVENFKRKLQVQSVRYSNHHVISESSSEYESGVEAEVEDIDSTKLSQHKKDEINDKLTKFIASSSLPFSIVKSDDFKDFVSSLNSSYKLPDVNTISRSLIKKGNYFNTKIIIKY